MPRFSKRFACRLSAQDKGHRIDNKELEFVWQPNPELGLEDTSIFTHVTWDQYRAPDGFRMFMTGDNDPFIVEQSSP